MLVPCMNMNECGEREMGHDVLCMMTDEFLDVAIDGQIVQNRLNETSFNIYHNKLDQLVNFEGILSIMNQVKYH